MAYLLDLLRKVEALDFEQIIDNSIGLAEDGIADAQREQMIHGYNSKGERIGVYAQASYERYKRERNPLAEGWVDLYDTGSFYQGIYATVIGDELVIDSDDEKTPELRGKYGEEIFGLSPDYKRQLLDNEIRPSFFLHLRNEINLP